MTDCRVTGLVSLTLCVAISLGNGSPRASGADKQDGARAVFASGKVWQFQITLSPEEFAAIQPRGGGRGFPGFGPQPVEPAKTADSDREIHRNNFGMDLPWGVGSVTIGDEDFGKVGVRYKGNGTIGDAARSIKKSLKIDLDRAGGTKRFAASKTINLHCGVTDPTKCRETLAYEVYRSAGVPAPRTALAEVRLTVPGKYDKELLGVYTIVEEVDQPFLRDRFGDAKGLLMKPEGLRDFTFQGDNWEAYKRPYAPKREATPAEAKRMIDFARLVDRGDDATFRKEISSYLDVDNYLRFLATTAFLANTDSFFGLGHNYYMYLHPTTNKLHFLPWDLDRAFANFGNATQNMDLSLTRPYGGAHRLTERLLAMPEISETYQALMKELAAGAFAKDRFSKELAKLEETIGELRERDAQAAANRREGGGAGFGPGMFGAPPDLKTFINARTESVVAQIEGKRTGFVPQGFGGFGPPGGGGRGPGGFPGGGRPGEVLPPAMQETLRLTDDQKKKLAELQKEVDEKIEKMLTEEQKRQFNEMKNRAPGGRGGFGPPGGR